MTDNIVLDSLDSSKSSLERLTDSVHSLLIHRDFHSWFPPPNVSRKEIKIKDDIHRFFFFLIIFPFYIDQNELTAVEAKTTQIPHNSVHSVCFSLR